MDWWQRDCHPCDAFFERAKQLMGFAHELLGALVSSTLRLSRRNSG